MDWLLRKMSGFEHRNAMIFEDKPIRFKEIVADYGQWLQTIEEHEIRPNEVIMLEGDYSPNVCAAILAFAANGNTVVPLTAGTRYKQDEMMSIAQVNRCIRFQGNRYSVSNPIVREHSPLLANFTSQGKAGLILFTSGTTGQPKAMLHDFAKFLERYKTSRETLRTLTFLLFDHIGGLNTLFHTLANGGTIIIPSSRNPNDICALIEKYNVELLPTTPSFLNLLLLSEAYTRYNISSLKMITYGTEVIPDVTLQQVRRALPNIELRQTYGLSEIGILRAKSRSSDSPWLMIGGEGIDTKIVNGILYIRSEFAMEGYLNAPNPFDEEGWFQTGDRVCEDNGYIRLLGRQSEMINVGGRKVYPVEVENVLMQMPELADVAVKGEPNMLLGQMVTAVVKLAVPMTGKELKGKVRMFCRDKLEDFQIPVKLYIQEEPLFTDRFKKMRR